jgi:Protein of unknown function (DUF3800)
MLSAYLDDSGTHADSTVVIWAALCANPGQWALLTELWQTQLNSPCPGKHPISRFRMFDCNNSLGEFVAWNRTETDFSAHEFTNILLRAGIYGRAFATPRKDWDELITGNLRVIFGDAEGFCVRNCYVQITNWAKEKASYDRELAFIFDARPPDRESENSMLFDIHTQFSEENGGGPKLVSLTFGSSKDFLPIQAADLFALEVYQHTKDVMANRTTPGQPLRSNLQKLAKGRRINVDFADRASITSLADRRAKDDPNEIANIASYLRTAMTQEEH